MTEVPLPVRFLFLLIGPAMDEYVDIGRALSTLFSTIVKLFRFFFLIIGLVEDCFNYIGFSRSSLSSNGSS